MIEQFEQQFAPYRPATRRSLARRLARQRARLTAISRRAMSLATAATLVAGGVALAQYDASPGQRERPVSNRTVEAASVAASGDTVEAADPSPQTEASPESAPEPERGPAYRLVAADGGVFTHGWYGFAGSAAGLAKAPVVGIAQTDDGDGYWLTSADGGVFSFGNAQFFGAAVGQAREPVVDIARTSTNRGYWLVSRDGGVFTFGDAGFHGSAVGVVSGRIVSVAATPSGNGYWLVSGDGGVFTFGDAGFFGAATDTRPNAPIMDIVPTPTGNGYYLVSADGGVFAFGDAPFHGSAAGTRLNRPIVDMSLDPNSSGYWLVGADGGVFAFGGAPYLGSPAVKRLAAPVTAIAGGRGKHAPSAAPAPEPEPAPAPAPAPAPPVVTAAAAPRAARAAASGGELLDGKFGWDISYPQCDGARPVEAFHYAIIGVNGGRAFRHNRCLADEWRWARQGGAAGVYVNVNFPRSADELARGATSTRQPACNGSLSCIAYNFGFNGIHDSMAYAQSQGVDVPFVWLDVEQLNYWTPDRALNAVVLRGAIDAVRELGMGVGIYSTPYQFNKLMGGEMPGVPVWTAGANGLGDVAKYCAERGFGGGPVAIVQLLPGQFDPNVACPGAGPMGTYFKLK